MTNYAEIPEIVSPAPPPRKDASQKGLQKTPSLRAKRSNPYFFLKFFFDFIFAGSFLLVLSPIFLWIAVLVKLSSPGPVFYRGLRVGRGGRLFRMFKFRTMIADAEGKGASSTAEGDPRLTRTGKFLRQYKLDELPQLINVLSGQMSVVGPRPQVAWAAKLYTEEQKALLSVRPGITDYASLRFRKEAQILAGSSDPDRDYLEKIAPEKIRLGLEYVREKSLKADLKIILATAGAFFGFSPDWVLTSLRANAVSAKIRGGSAALSGGSEAISKAGSPRPFPPEDGSVRRFAAGGARDDERRKISDEII